MKRGLFALILVFGMGVAVVAQSPVPFHNWPALYDAAENLSVKRGINRDGTVNDKVYIRIGWGSCLAIYQQEFDDLIAAAQTDRYINLRQYASERLNPPDDAWGADDNYNCPKPPLQVKPYYRGSRPTYYRDLNEEGTHYIRGRKAPYRVSAAEPLPTCEPLGVLEYDNYKVVSADTTLYYGDETMLASEISPRQVVAVCEDQDVNLLDYRWTQ